MFRTVSSTCPATLLERRKQDEPARPRATSSALGGLMSLTVLAGISLVAQPAVARADNMDGCFGADHGSRIEACTQLLEEPLSRVERSLAYAMRALAYSVRGDYAQALPDYDRAIELRPNFAVALNNRAWAHFKSGNVAQGFEDVERSLALSPQSAHALDTRAHLRQSEGDIQGALQDYKKAMRFGGARMVRLYQCGLQTAGYYAGPLSGLISSDLKAALETCVRSKSCDPLPPDEECRKLTS